MAFNKIILMGNLTRDPELRSTTSGSSVTSFALAVNRTWNNAQGERQEETSFIDCEAWGRTGETIAKYVSKGRQLLVSGRLRQDTWQDKDGAKRSKHSISVESFEFLESKGAQPQQDEYQAQQIPGVSNKPHGSQIDDIDEDDIPFSRG